MNRDKSTLNRIFLSPPHMSGEEMRFVKEAFESNYIAPLGPQVDAFEQEFAEYVGIKHCLALSSGTAAMHLAMRLLGVGSAPEECASLSPPVNSTGQGDEVIASTLTFIGSVTPVVFEGATPVFIDCDRISWNMDPDLLAQELAACERRGKMPKAVIPTDLYGQCCDLPRIVEICDGYGVPVVCDSAEAMGAKYHPQITQITQKVHAGVGAKATVFSFNGNKIITTSGGGMLASDDKEFIERARFLSQQARENFPHYEHQEIGFNYRMSNVLAAIGRGQLRVLDERVKKRREIFDYYREALGSIAGIEFMPEAGYGRCNRWLTVILVTPAEFGADRKTVRLALEAENIEARPVWKPMHLQPVFNPQITPVPSAGATGQAQIDADYKKLEKRYKARVVGGEVAEDLFNRGLCLPSGTQMTNVDLDRVMDAIISRRCRDWKVESRN